MVQIVILSANGESRTLKTAAITAAATEVSVAKALRKVKTPDQIGTYDWKGLTLTVWGWREGKADTENKHELPPPHDEGLLFGDVIVTGPAGIDFTVDLWTQFYDAAFGGFEDLGSEDSECEVEVEVEEVDAEEDDESDDDASSVDEVDAEDSDEESDEEEEEEEEEDEDGVVEEKGVQHKFIYNFDDDDLDEEEKYLIEEHDYLNKPKDALEQLRISFIPKEGKKLSLEEQRKYAMRRQLLEWQKEELRKAEHKRIQAEDLARLQNPNQVFRRPPAAGPQKEKKRAGLIQMSNALQGGLKRKTRGNGFRTKKNNKRRKTLKKRRGRKNKTHKRIY